MVSIQEEKRPVWRMLIDLFLISPARAFRQVFSALGQGTWGMAKGFFQILVVLLYMLVVIPPQLVLYAACIAILWPIAKFEEAACAVLARTASSLEKGIDSLKSFIDTMREKIDAMNQKLMSIDFSGRRPLSKGRSLRTEGRSISGEESEER